MSNWRIYTVQELIDEGKLDEPLDGNHGGLHPKTSDYVSSGVPFIMAKDLQNGTIDYANCAYITDEKAATLRKGFAHPGDVLLTHKATLGRTAIVPNKYPVTILTPQVTYYRIKKGINNRYLKYYFDSKPFQQTLKNWAGSGSTRAYLGIKAQHKLPIVLPDLETQNKIVEILEPFDRKIFENEEINKNLQAQAQAIYAHMIIDEANESWSQGLLSDIATITMGQSPKGDTYNENSNGTVFFQGRAEFGFRFPTRRLYTTDPKRMAQANDVLMSVRAPVGDINVAYEDCCIGRGLGAIHSKDNHQSFVLYTMFALRDQLDVFNGEGTVFGSINRDALNSMPVSIPPREVIDKFESVVSPMDNAIRNNYGQSCHLKAMRDSLLPRLMSGEIDVSDIDL